MMSSAGRLPKPARAPKPFCAKNALSRSVRNLFQTGSDIRCSFAPKGPNTRAQPSMPVRQRDPRKSADLSLAAFALALVGIEEALPQPDRFGRHLAELVIGDIGDRLLQGHEDRRGQADRFIRGLRANIG